jgi:hypothetical protein
MSIPNFSIYTYEHAHDNTGFWYIHEQAGFNTAFRGVMYLMTRGPCL